MVVYLVYGLKSGPMEKKARIVRSAEVYSYVKAQKLFSPPSILLAVLTRVHGVLKILISSEIVQ